MKELIYTIIFAGLAVVLICLLVFMFGSGRQDTKTASATEYTPGVYTSSVQLEGQALDVQVVVDESHINSVSIVNLDATVATMYPLIQSSMDDISAQIQKKQSTKDISYTEENHYTATVLVNAVEQALKKAEVQE